MNELQIMNIEGVECYEKDGIAYLKLETVVRGLGFTTIAASGNEVVRWNTVHKYLCDLGVAPSCNGSDYRGKCPDFIPENIFYRLAMKAKNETAERFQAKVADEIIPSIRKHGAYMTPETLEKALLSPDFLIRLAQKLKEEQEKVAELTKENRDLAVYMTQCQPKVEYFDDMVRSSLLSTIRETAKMLHTGEKKFVAWLIDNHYLYRGQSGKLLPYSELPHGLLFEVKEVHDPKRNWYGVQTFVTPMGRETFRRLYRGYSGKGAFGRDIKPERLATQRELNDVEDFFYREARKKNKKSKSPEV